VPSTQVSLVREHTEVIRPPRALWVPFMLGRPLGVPGDPGFQRDVLLAALRLFEEPAGPVLRDFERDAPAEAEDESGAVCPVHFSRPPLAGEGADAQGYRLGQEIAQLRPWHDLAVERRTASSSGISGMSFEECGAFLASFVRRGTATNHRPEQDLGLSLKQACDDLRAFYEEAAGAQPGGLSADAMQEWLYHATVLGELLERLWREGADSSDESVRNVTQRFLLPWAVQARHRAEQQ
jgi:hypothetical protein